MAFDYSPPPKLWKPVKPAIIRATNLPRSYAEANKIALDGEKVAHLPGMAALWGGVAGPAAKVLTKVDDDDISSTTATPSFTSIDFGAEASDRRIIVAIAGTASNRALTGGTIGGVTADVVISQAGNTQRSSGILIAHVPTGTSGTVAPTWDGTNSNHTIVVFRATGLSSNTAIDFDGSTVDPSSMAMDTVAGGFVIMIANANGTGGNTWTNITNVVNPTPSSGRVVCGYELTAGSSLTVGNDWDGSTTARSACAASW